MLAVDIDITPLLTQPDRQRSKKLLESCLREINYLMSQPTSLPPTAIHANMNANMHDNQPITNQEWNHQREIRPQSQSEEISYIGIDNDPPPQDEELPRKLPKKVPVSSVPDAQSQSPSYPPPEQIPRPLSPKLNTILERSPAPRSFAKSAFQESPSSQIFKDLHVTRTRDMPSPQTRTFTNIHTLRSHLLPVRALIPCNTATTLSDETCFVSAGDDSTIKFWRVNNRANHLNPKKKSSNFDILPQITFRGHTGMVTSLAESGGYIWSGGIDSSIRGWCVPPATRDAYGPSADAASINVLEGHTNCVWSVAVPGTGQPLLVSGAADRTVKIWDTRVHS